MNRLGLRLAVLLKEVPGAEAEATVPPSGAAVPPSTVTPHGEAPPLAVAPFSPEEAKQHQERWAKHLGVPVVETNSIGMQMVLIPPGEFMVGSDEQEEIRRHTGAVPRHRSYTRGLMISRHEVTFAEYLPQFA